MATPDPAMRAGDADRNEIIGVLGDAFADGRLDYEEFEHRHSRAVGAKTLRELQLLVRDLPGTAEQPAGLVLTAALHAQHRTGRWEVPARIVLIPAVSQVKLDFRRATCPHRTVSIEVKPGLGRIRLIVPRGWGVRTDELRPGWGSIRNDLASEPIDDRPTLVVTGKLGVGRVHVRRPRFSAR